MAGPQENVRKVHLARVDRAEGCPWEPDHPGGVRTSHLPSIHLMDTQANSLQFFKNSPSLTTLFNSLQGAPIPEHTNMAYIKVLPKQDKDPSLAASYYPILNVELK